MENIFQSSFYPHFWHTFQKFQLVADLRRSVSGWLSDSNDLKGCAAAQQEMGTGENIRRSPDPRGHILVSLGLNPVQKWIPST
jgi:hypothetical protein